MVKVLEPVLAWPGWPLPPDRPPQSLCHEKLMLFIKPLRDTPQMFGADCKTGYMRWLQSVSNSVPVAGDHNIFEQEGRTVWCRAVHLGKAK